MKRVLRLAAWGTAAMLLPPALWFALYTIPGLENDAHQPRYVLWKAGLLPFNRDLVFRCLVQDRSRDRLVQGLTVPEIERRFHCSIEKVEHWGEGETTWRLGKSRVWFVKMRGGKGMGLVLSKG